MFHRKDLTPGMKVKNILSGNKGIVLADPTRPNRIMRAHSSFVQVKTVGGTRKRRAVWNLVHVALV